MTLRNDCEANEIAAHLSWIRSYARGITSDNWADMALYISRQVDRLEYAIAEGRADEQQRAEKAAREARMA
jgi:hypothetical protein